MTYAGPNKLKDGQKFLCAVWGPGDFHITKRQGFKTIEGALRYANKRVEEPGVHEVVILVKDKSNREWPWRRIEVIKNQERERIREAAKREAQEARAARGRKRT